MQERGGMGLETCEFYKIREHKRPAGVGPYHCAILQVL